MSNKSVKEALYMLYGKKCMFVSAGIPSRLKGMDITGYKQYIDTLHYKSRKLKILANNMTLHHLVHQSENGKTDIENGAIVSELAHRYIHSLPRDKEEVINNMLREYKRNYGFNGGVLVPTDTSIEMTQSIQIDLDFNIGEDCIVIPVYDDKEPAEYNRAEIKQETSRLIREANDEYDLDI